jgi:hypothetical protein
LEINSVGRRTIVNDLTISTAELPFDYEVMVFNKKGYSVYYERFLEPDEAYLGHLRIEEMVRRGTINENTERV